MIQNVNLIELFDSCTYIENHMPIALLDNGTENVVNIPKEGKGAIAIEIYGNKNTIEIPDPGRFENLKISVSGDSGSLILKPSRVGRLSIGIKNGSTVIIGPDTTIENAYLLADHGKTISTGRDCMISFNVQIRTTDAHGIFCAKTGRRLNAPGNVVIGDHVWIGQGVLIGKNTSIGRNSIVGANSFLQNTSFPPSCIIAGTPGRLIRRQVVWDRREVDSVSLDEMDPQFSHWWNIAKEDLGS